VTDMTDMTGGHSHVFA